MTFSELRAKLNEGMTTGIFSYGLDFQVDEVDQSVEDFGDYADDLSTSDDLSRGSVNDKFKEMKQKFYRKGGKLPWEIENAASATQRQIALNRWLKAASGNNLQVVNDKSLVNIPKWQEVEIKS